MENIWGPQRKTGNMEEESLREENRKAHEEDERFRMTAVKAAGQVRQRMRCATGESDEVIRRKFMLPERYILTLMTVETLGQERMLLDLMAGGRLGADLVLCGRRSFYADMLLRTARDRRLALRTNFYLRILARGVERFFPHGRRPGLPAPETGAGAACRRSALCRDSGRALRYPPQSADCRRCGPLYRVSGAR